MEKKYFTIARDGETSEVTYEEWKLAMSGSNDTQEIDSLATDDNRHRLEPRQGIHVTIKTAISMMELVAGMHAESSVQSDARLLQQVLHRLEDVCRSNRKEHVVESVEVVISDDAVDMSIHLESRNSYLVCVYGSCLIVDHLEDGVPRHSIEVKHASDLLEPITDLIRLILRNETASEEE